MIVHRLIQVVSVARAHVRVALLVAMLRVTLAAPHMAAGMSHSQGAQGVSGGNHGIAFAPQDTCSGAQAPC